MSGVRPTTAGPLVRHTGDDGAVTAVSVSPTRLSLARGMPRHRWLRLAAAAVMLLIPACGPRTSSWVRPDYEMEDRTETLRLGVLTTPHPGGDEKLAELWTTLARQYANQHRDFIARSLPDSSAQGASAWCDEGGEGILLLEPTRLEENRRGFDLGVKATMTRCRDGELVWKASAAGSFASEDPHLVEVRRRYEADIGEAVGPLVAPCFRLIRAALSTLPRPRLEGEDDLMEKIELGE